VRPYLRVPLITLLSASLLFSPTLPAQGINLPDIGGAGDQALSPQEENRLGVEVMIQLHRQGQMLDDVQVTSYLQQLGQRLLAHADTRGQEFTFFVMRDNTINAFALPGGYIGVNSSLILATSDESELAGVMAHEISHVTQRHIARSIAASSGLNMATMAGMLAAILLSRGNGQVAQAAISTGMAAQIENAIRFTNQNEMEADRIGMRVLADANFDSLAMPRFFEELQARTRYYENEYSNFLRDHPVTSERISDAQARARHYPPVKLIESRGYLLTKARVAALTASDLNQAERVFAEQAAKLQGTPRDAALYGQGLVLLRAGSAAKAAPQFAELARRQPDEPAYRQALADAQLAQGKTEDALATYAQAITLFPDNIALVLAYSTTLLQANKGAAAWQQLQRLPVDRNAPAEQFRLLAQAAQMLNRTAQVHDLLAEYALRRGNARQALEQWHIALNTPDPQHLINPERIKQRMRELEHMLRDMQNG